MHGNRRLKTARRRCHPSFEDEPFYYVGLDGLIFNHNDLEIFCTNKEIIDKFYRKKIVYSNISIEYILRLIKCAKNYSEASIYNLYSEKKVIDDEIPFYFFLGTIGQDYQFLPNSLYALSIIDSMIFIIETDIDIEIKDIKECEKYKSLSSNPEEEYKKYCDCFSENFQNNYQYKIIEKQVKQIQDLVLSFE